MDISWYTSFMRSCSLCDKKHYAKSYCRRHYNNLLYGRNLVFYKCAHVDCNTTVTRHVKERLCHFHYKQLFNRHFKMDGGKWGYKNWRLNQKLKKDYCELCNNKKILYLHHKDSNTRNSAPDNLMTVCSTCHAKIHHYKRREPKLINKSFASSCL